MAVSRALTDEELQREIDDEQKSRTLVDEVLDEIKAERRAYIEEIGFEKWFEEFRARESAPYPRLEKFLDQVFAELEEKERQKAARSPIDKHRSARRNITS